MTLLLKLEFPVDKWNTVVLFHVEAVAVGRLLYTWYLLFDKMVVDVSSSTVTLDHLYAKKDILLDGDILSDASDFLDTWAQVSWHTADRWNPPVL